jgi:hypothetical protein
VARVQHFRQRMILFFRRAGLLVCVAGKGLPARIDTLVQMQQHCQDEIGLIDAILNLHRHH